LFIAILINIYHVRPLHCLCFLPHTNAIFFVQYVHSHKGVFIDKGGLHECLTGWRCVKK